jgi:hypothetical protein
MKTLPPTARAALALCAALLLPINAAAPQGPPYSPELQQLLQRLADVAESLEHSLPSLTCVETGVSEGLNKGKVKKHVDFTANMRAVRTPAGALSESFTLTQINGKPYSKSSYSFPFYTRGGFDSALAYFLPTHQPCYVFTLSSPGRIDFHITPDAASHPPCHADGMRGFAFLDPHGNITHIERTVSAQAVQDFQLTPFAAIDFAPVELNGHLYRLSHHIVTEYARGDNTGRFEATYSNCQLFTASVTILPPTQVVPDNTQPPQ